MLKSPSLGLNFPIVVPVYLAHYPMMQTEEGRKKLQEANTAKLLRLSVGLEPVEEIIGALRFALQ